MTKGRYTKEKLTDNTKISYCEQCEACIHWGKSGTPWDNKYDKRNCEMFMIPNDKPEAVIHNTAPCPYRQETE